MDFGNNSRSVTLSHSKYQKIGQRNRQKEIDREETLRRIQHEKVLQTNMASEDRVEERRFLRNIQKLKKEQDTDEAIKKAQLQKAMKDQLREQEDKLAKELQAIKLDSMRTEKLKQHCRENSLELKELEAKLRAGYMNKERAAQVAEKQAIKQNSALLEAEMSRQMDAESERGKQMEAAVEQARWERSVQYQEQLERQLQEQEEQKQRQYEDFLKEKLMIDEIIRKIHEEDQRDIEARLAKQKATRGYIDEFMKKREMWKQEAREQMEDENKKIMEFAREQQRREEQRFSDKKEKELEMSNVQKELSDKITEEQREREEMERVRMELYFEEQEEANRIKEMLDVEKRIRERLELQETMRQQLDFKQQKREAEKEEEEEFRRQTLEKFYEDDRVEQMNAQKRRMRQLEHRRAVEKLIQERRDRLQQDKERVIAEQEEMERLEAERKKIIEEERRRLLQEHAAKLVGYLPKGVLRDSKDLDLFDAEFKEAYSKRPNSFGDDDVTNK